MTKYKEHNDNVLLKKLKVENLDDYKYWKHPKQENN